MNSKVINSANHFEVFFAYFSTFIGCTVNAIVMEYINSIQPNSNIFLTLVQFLFVSLISYFIAMRNSADGILPASEINRKDLLACAALNAASSITANWALNFNVSLPIHVIGRSTTILFTIFVGNFFDGKKYNFEQLKYAFMVMIGVFLAATDTKKLWELISMIISASKNLIDYFFPPFQTSIEFIPKQTLCSQGPKSLVYWYPYIGALLIFISLLCQAFLSSLQNKILRKRTKMINWNVNDSLMHRASDNACLNSENNHHDHDNLAKLKHITSSANPHWSVLLFYTHAYGLFFFIIFFSSISATIIDVHNCYNHNAHDIFNIYTLIVLYGLTQFMCVSGVYQLKRFFDELYISIITNSRKLFTVISSILIFDHDFTLAKFIGAILVVSGTIFYGRVKSHINTVKNNKQQTIVV